MCDRLFGKFFGDKGYISQQLFKKLLFLKGISLITKTKKKMKPRLMSLFDRILLRKRSLIERARHRGPVNAMAHVPAGLIAHTRQPVKPSIRFSEADLKILNIIRP